MESSGIRKNHLHSCHRDRHSEEVVGALAQARMVEEGGVGRGRQGGGEVKVEGLVGERRGGEAGGWHCIWSVS